MLTLLESYRNTCQSGSGRHMCAKPPRDLYYLCFEDEAYVKPNQIKYVSIVFRDLGMLDGSGMHNNPPDNNSAHSWCPFDVHVWSLHPANPPAHPPTQPSSHHPTSLCASDSLSPRVSNYLLLWVSDSPTLQFLRSSESPIIGFRGLSNFRFQQGATAY